MVLPSQFPTTPEDDSKLTHSLSGPLTSKSPKQSPLPYALSQAQSSSKHPLRTHPLAPSYSGPFKVFCRSPYFFLLQLGPQTEWVSVHRFKPANLPSYTPPALPPSRGRPPSSLPLSFPSPKQSSRPTFPFLLLNIPISHSNFHLFSLPALKRTPTALNRIPTSLSLFQISSFPEKMWGDYCDVSDTIISQWLSLSVVIPHIQLFHHGLSCCWFIAWPRK